MFPRGPWHLAALMTRKLHIPLLCQRCMSPAGRQGPLSGPPHWHWAALLWVSLWVPFLLCHGYNSGPAAPSKVTHQVRPACASTGTPTAAVVLRRGPQHLCRRVQTVIRLHPCKSVCIASGPVLHHAARLPCITRPVPALDPAQQAELLTRPSNLYISSPQLKLHVASCSGRTF